MSGAQMSLSPAASRRRDRRVAFVDDGVEETMPPRSRTRTSPSDNQPECPAAATATLSASEDTAGENFGTPTPEHAPGIRRSLILT